MCVYENRIVLKNINAYLTRLRTLEGRCYPVGKIAEKAVCKSAFFDNMALYFEC